MKNKPTQRYQHPQVIEHIASQYVLGTLTSPVHRRVSTLAIANEALELAIQYWQARLVSLDHQTDELPASETSWQAIAEHLDITSTLEFNDNQQVTDHKISQDDIKPVTVNVPDNATENTTDNTCNSWFNHLAEKFNRWLSTPSYRYASAFSILLFAVLLAFIKPLTQTNNNNAPLSYIAVLTEQEGQAHLVASTYGESLKLVINIINAPQVNDEESLELWVVSKTDQQARSLGVLPVNQSLLEQQLTNAQWRLIKDSDSLIVTVEEAGGSAIGEPSEMIVSRGICVRLQEWNKDV